MASQVTNYKCPACTGPLHFVGASGKLECDFCGGKYDVADIERLYAGKEAAAVEASEKAEAKAEGQPQKMADMEAQGWDTSGLTSDWGAEADGMKAYQRPSSGAELICDAALPPPPPHIAATHGGAGAVQRHPEAGLRHSLQAQ